MEERIASPVVVHPHHLQQEQPRSRRQQPRRSHALKPPTALYSMRTAMPHFVSALRVVDDWKRQHAKRAEAIAQAEYDVSAKFVKSAFARSVRLEDLARFVDDTQLDIDFMVQLPSIEKCLEQWWHMYVHEAKSVDQDVLRTVFYDLATVLVEAKTENIHKNSVSMIVRGPWTKWSAKEPPLAKPEFFRLLFVLAHLMTTSNRLNDYVVFLQETLARITRVQQSKAARSALRQIRQPRSRRKLSLHEILSSARASGGPVVVPFALASQDLIGNSDALSAHDSTANDGGGGDSVGSARKVPSLSASVPLPVASASRDGLFDDAAEPLAPGRFVEVLERHSRGQHMILDPLLHEAAFQNKWKRASRDATMSLNALAAERNPVTSAFAPPMMIHRLRASRSATCVTGGVTSDTSQPRAEGLTAGEEEILRRSLSRVTLKERVARKKLAGASPHHADGIKSPFSGRPQDSGSGANNTRGRDADKPPVYLAIST